MYETTPMCERCREPFEPAQEGQRYCSGRCREAAKKRRSRLRPLAAKLLGTTGDTGDTLTGAYQRSAPAEFASPDASYVVPDAADDETGIYADDAGRDDDINQSWSASISLQSQLDGILAEYDKRAAPYLDTQKRNGGVVLPQLARLRREYAVMAQALIDDQARTSALERADRTRGLRIDRASDRAAGQRAMHEFAQDLHRRGIDLPNAGRATSDVMGLRENSDPFSRSDREMYGSSAIARNMMSSGFGSFPGDTRFWR